MGIASGPKLMHKSKIHIIKINMTKSLLLLSLFFICNSQKYCHVEDREEIVSHSVHLSPPPPLLSHTHALSLSPIFLIINLMAKYSHWL